MSEVQIKCPKCSADLLIDKEELDALQGTTINCIDCNAEIVLPSLQKQMSGTPKFCSSCGNAIGSNAKFCTKCGASISGGSGASTHSGQPKIMGLAGQLNQTTMKAAPLVNKLISKPVQQPSHSPETEHPDFAGIGPLWNPRTAANWSILFTPIFGSLLQASNWETLGEPEKAKKARLWAWFAIPLYVALMFVPAKTTSIQLLFLFVWYFASGKQQAKWVKEHYGNDYPHKSRQDWSKPLGIALAIMIGIILLAGTILTLMQ